MSEVYMNVRVHRLFAIIPLLFVAMARGQNGPPPTPPAPADVSSTGSIAGPSEPGKRLIVDGQVFAPDGVTLAAGVILYAYQTDSSGLYHDDSSHIARLHGWVKTDAQGRFEFRTIRPAPYPNRSIPAHIHFHAWGGGYPLQWTEELKFADDPLLTPHDVADSQAHGDFAIIRPVTRGADRAWHCTVRFRLSRQTNYPAQYRDDPRTR
jgi:protocatechuate 3,4-dioxygenase, beta subunit